jgi:DNA-binding PadR family transcriptional regulator
LGLIEIKQEPRFTRGRPRKLCKLTESGFEYFTGLLMGASDGDHVESRAPFVAREGIGGE